ncbi:class I SAM-dependent methyltransferase [Patescibacteria group bacterium]|nr:class I SAM-dependent methyltransferase [Patescibacteria group bacterium]
MDLNKKAWDKIGKNAVSSFVIKGKFLEFFKLFCKKLSKNATVLDLGCGPGIPITKQLTEKGFDVTAIDISDTMIRLAKKNVPRAKHIQISMTDIDFINEFDGVISSYTMLCLDPSNFKKTAKKIYRALKSGGFFLITLNEPPPNGHNEEENITEIMGQKIYSRPYTEEEIREIFSGYKMKFVKVGREIMVSDKYGKEYSLLILMQKL